jgi:hypothetical protein
MRVAEIMTELVRDRKSPSISMLRGNDGDYDAMILAEDRSKNITVSAEMAHLYTVEGRDLFYWDRRLFYAAVLQHLFRCLSCCATHAISFSFCVKTTGWSLNFRK